MKCVNPYYMKNPKFPDESDLAIITCPCNKCYACLVNKRREWLFRLTEESQYHKFMFFITLTYDDSNCDGYVHRSHLQKFFKSLRHICNFKYYAIGEYGTSNTHRPHYHIALFTDFDLSNIILPWRSGFYSCLPATIAGLNYVLHYHVRPKEPVKGKKTFFTCSKGLGMQVLFDANGEVKQSILRKLSTTTQRIIASYRGDTFVIPRYYTKKLQELGYDIKMPSNSVVDDRCIKLIQSILPDVVFYSNGQCANYPDYMIASLLVDIQSNSKRKLKRYNYQTKTQI